MSENTRIYPVTIAADGTVRKADGTRAPVEPDKVLQALDDVKAGRTRPLREIVKKKKKRLAQVQEELCQAKIKIRELQESLRFLAAMSRNPMLSEYFWRDGPTCDMPVEWWIEKYRKVMEAISEWPTDSVNSSGDTENTGRNTR